MRPYAVHGAGAVGSALAAYLARRGHPVWITCRGAHLSAIQAQGGIRVVSREESFQAPVEASPLLPATLPADTVLFLTVQAQDVAESVRLLAAFAPVHPLMTWQNGIRAEALAAATFPRVFGGVVRCTATRLEPGEVRLRAPGQLVVGKHPRGVDAFAASIVEDLRAAGFEAAESPEIGADKALKLLVNLVSGPAVLLRRTGKEPALAAVQAALLEEALRIYAAHGIEARPASGLGAPAEALLSHFHRGGTAPDTSGGVYNSTWQNLHHRRPRIENDAYHGEIVRLARAVGLEAPVNARALEILEAVRREGLGPEAFDVPSFRERFADVVDFAVAAEGDTPEAPRGLEI